MKQFILASTVITTALVTGVFYAFAIAVNLAFQQLPDAAYIEAMQAINRAIVNPGFAISFFGAPVLLPLATYMYAKPVFSQRAGYLLVATLLFLIGSFGVTVLANIPLNDQLAVVTLTGKTNAQLFTARHAFADAWNNWHLVRTLCSIGALILLVVACFKKV
ncbi:DUF1772 domain-containing protein [Chitinophaga sp. 30R24]|uniref:anthrone oxygenase family protein n=1 Tax=Chitinophaga sp. 30R24 TaxID=3248838 RepID=UPI003B91EC4F